MRYWTGAAFVVALAMVQTSSVAQFRPLGVSPNLMLVLLVCWVVVRGLDDALPMIAVAGVALGLLDLETPGLALLALLPVAVLGLVRELRVVASEGLLALALVAAATMAYEAIMLLSLLLTGGDRDVLAGVTRAVAPAAIVNVAITPPVYLLMRLARPAGSRYRLAF